MYIGHWNDITVLLTHNFILTAPYFVAVVSAVIIPVTHVLTSNACHRVIAQKLPGRTDACVI